MAEFPLVVPRDPGAEARAVTAHGALSIAHLDAASVAAQLAELSGDLGTAFAGQTSDAMRLESIVVKLTLTAEGKIAFIASGSVEGSIEVTFARPSAELRAQ